MSPSAQRVRKSKTLAFAYNRRWKCREVVSILYNELFVCVTSVRHSDHTHDIPEDTTRSRRD